MNLHVPVEADRASLNKQELSPTKAKTMEPVLEVEKGK